MVPPGAQRKSRLIDLTGQHFGRLCVLGLIAIIPPGYSLWACRCDCGNFLAVKGAHLTRKTKPSRSCGCLRRENMGPAAVKALTIHGHSAGGRWTPEFLAWVNMKGRCSNRRSKDWPNYGGRGIRVCDEWLHDFPKFLTDIGPRPSSKHSIDRIDNDGNYEPGNVRWATRSEQAFNRRPR